MRNHFWTSSIEFFMSGRNYDRCSHATYVVLATKLSIIIVIAKVVQVLRSPINTGQIHEA